ncbi:unnamed protein product [Hydatigera taeniaeformis]|uniref:Dynein light chain 1, cytoplasmic n=1 Tax=Hydatigena taeniaeformis TaxID=6205 RepID=A0A158RFB1_HYDTA|nr:unnamed protein product [Hydatigera taeniaeformis]
MTSTSPSKAIIKNADMSEEMQQRAIDCAKDAMNQFTIEKDIAAYLKKEFDKLYSPTWHCIVGRNFGRDSREWNAGDGNFTPLHRAHTHTLLASHIQPLGRYRERETGESMNGLDNLLNDNGGKGDKGIQVVVRSTDMNDAQQTEAANIIAEALTIHYKETQVAKMVKTHFDEKYGRAWQCIVGKHFARYVSTS